jgi:hypothetical protein
MEKYVITQGDNTLLEFENFMRHWFDVAKKQGYGVEKIEEPDDKSEADKTENV